MSPLSIYPIWTPRIFPRSVDSSMAINRARISATLSEFYLRQVVHELSMDKKEAGYPVEVRQISGISRCRFNKLPASRADENVSYYR